MTFEIWTMDMQGQPELQAEVKTGEKDAENAAMNLVHSGRHRHVAMMEIDDIGNKRTIQRWMNCHLRESSRTAAA